MAFRLVLDYISRKWLVIGFAVVQIYFVRQASWSFWPRTDPMAWLLLFCAFLSVQAGAALESREIYQLPISRRTLWLGRWWLATAGVVLVVQPPVVLAQWSAQSSWPNLEQLVTSTTCAFLYCGCLMALAATQLGRWADKPLSIQPTSAGGAARSPIPPVSVKWLIFRAFLRVVPGMLGALLIPVVAPFLFARYLPHTFSSINATSAVLMLAMTAGAVWGYRYRPAAQARLSRRNVRAAAPRSDQASTKQSGTKNEQIADRLTGLRLPLWQASRKYLITYSSVIALGIAWWWVTSFYRTVLDLPTLLGRLGMLPLASPSAHVVEGITVGALFIIAGMLEVGLIANIRPLRVLPLSTTQLCCIPLALGLVSAGMLWTVFLVLHALVLHTFPVSFRIDLFTAFVALAALSNVLRFTISGQPPVRAMIGFAPLAVIWLALGYFDTFRTDIVQPAMFAGGLLILAASFAVMRRAVTRSSRIYQRPAASMS